MKKIVLSLIVLMSLVSCSDDFTGDKENLDIVVEGYIETNQLAKVFLTFPFSLNDEIGEETYKNFINSYAKVIVTCGSEREILTFKKDENLIPPYYYTTTLMTGEAGKSYLLEVIYNGDTATAVTTIPEKAVVIDDFWCEPIDNDTLHRNLYVTFNKLYPDSTSYYKFFTKTSYQHTFYPTSSSTVNDELFNGNTMKIGTYAGAENLLDTNTTTYFSIGDTVTIKVATIDKESWAFWNQYENETSFNNPFSHGSNLPSNIQGGLGIWTGMNAVRKRIVVK